MPPTVAPSPDWRPPVRLLRAAATAACGLVLLAAVWAAMQVGTVLAPVLLPLAVVALLTRVLSVPAGWLRSRGWGPGLSAAATMLGAAVLAVGLVALLGPPFASEVEGLGPTVRDGVDDVQTWLVEDSPFDLTRQDVEDARTDLEDRARSALEAEGLIGKGVRVVLEVLAGLVVAIVLTFFAVKDGPEIVGRARDRLPDERRDQVEAVGRAVWRSLGGYLRGSATLGAIEAVVIGLTLFLVGADLVLPVALITFLAAFVPVVGATTAGVVAVLVAIAGGGLVPAVIVGVVALVVQQLDNDLLGPWVFGSALDLHPAVVLLALLAGTALFGVVGTFLAVPVTACTTSALKAAHAHSPTTDPPPDG